MSWLSRFTRKTHKYETRGELADMTSEEILRLDPDDVGFYIRNKPTGLNHEQENALENLLEYKKRAKKIGRENINREEEIRNYLLDKTYGRKNALDVIDEQYDLWKTKEHDTTLDRIDLWNLLFGQPIRTSIPDEEKEDFEEFVEHLKTVLNPKYQIYPLTEYRQTPTPSTSARKEETPESTTPELIPDNEYYVTFSDPSKDARIVLKVHFVRYAEPPTTRSLLMYEIDFVHYRKIPAKLPRLFESDVYPYYFIPNGPNSRYGFFRIMEVVSFTNISPKAEYRTVGSLTKVSVVPDIMGMQLFGPILDFVEEENTLDWYFYPGKLIWVLLSPNETVRISNILPPYPLPNEEETSLQFVTTFTDYPDFIQFINDYVSQLSPIEFQKYYSCLSPSYFTTRAPTGYSFSTITDPAILTAERPFYSAIKHIFSIIPHFSPSTLSEGPNHFSEHTYFVYLNRLIYYYNLHQSISKNELHGFENTAVIVIQLHGAYISFDETVSLKKQFPNIENLFICTRSAPGAYSIHCPGDTASNKFATEGNLYDQLYDSITQFHGISFDKIILETFKSSIGIIEANCWIENKQFGRSMQNYINPNTKGYINKIYTGSYHDGQDKIIDMQLFRGTAEESDIQTRIDKSNILLDPDLLKVLGKKSFIHKSGSQNIMSCQIQLREIIKYYNLKRGIKNIFIYDTSCGDIESSTDADAYLKNSYGQLQSVHPERFSRKRTEMEKVTSKLAKLGFGVSKRKQPRKTRRTHNNKQPRSTRRYKRPFFKG